jgi:hypothetical protein
MNETPLDLAKVSTPRCAKVLMQKSWKTDIRDLAWQLELELGIVKKEQARLGVLAAKMALELSRCAVGTRPCLQLIAAERQIAERKRWHAELTARLHEVDPEWLHGWMGSPMIIEVSQ